MKKIVWFFLIGLIIYGLNVFGETEEFQQSIKFFVRFIQASNTFVVPQFWIDNRMLIWGTMIAFLLLGYQSVWRSYQLFISIYRSRATIAQKPSLSVQQANYLLLQNPVSSVVLWLIQLCEVGVLTLHYKGGVRPWSISRNRIKPASSEEDQKLINNLFKSKNKRVIEDSFSDPNPDFRVLSDYLFNKIESENKCLVKKRISSFPIWLVLACMCIETPFVSAVYTDTPAVVFIVLCFVIFTAAVVYLFIYLLRSFFSGHYVMVLLVSIIPLLVLAIPHWGLLGMSHSNYYFFIVFYPEVVVTIAMLIRFSPLLPKDHYLLSHIIAYKNHLQQSQTSISESDLPWTMGLEAHSRLFEKKWIYGENQLPNWIESEEEDIQKVMHALYTSFSSSINSAIYGEVKSKHSSSRGLRRSF